MNVAWALRFQVNISIDFFWRNAFLTMIYFINRAPSMILDGKIHYEIVHGHPPSYEHLRVFGSSCYAHNQKTLGDKFTSRSRKYIFIRYPYGKKILRLFDLETQ